eukprot:SAG22_NODE_1_length_62449_cov_158.689270_63_plen_52_part_00
MALLLACFVVSTTITGELKDITLCLLALERAGDRISAPFRGGIIVMNWVRR